MLNIFIDFREGIQTQREILKIPKTKTKTLVSIGERTNMGYMKGANPWKWSFMFLRHRERCILMFFTW